MISDLQSVQGEVALDTDLCIIGSGPAGLTLASEFADTQHRVVLLEAGGFERERASQAFYQSISTARPYQAASSRLRMFGGTSGHWLGQCSVIPERHMTRRPGITDASWPIRSGDLARHYKKAHRLLELGHYDYDSAAARSAEFGIELDPDGLLDPVICRYRPGEALRFGTRMRDDMNRAANIHVFLHANVTRLVTNGQANHVNEVRFSTIDGKKGLVRARAFVLACGGLEIPRLLLNTDDIVPAGLGNRRGLVGRYFMEHPNAVIGTLHLSSRRGARAMTLLSDRLLDHTEPTGSATVAFCTSERFEREQRIGGGAYRFLSRAATSRWLQARTRFVDGQGSFFERMHALATYFDEWAYAKYRLAGGRSSDFARFDDYQAVVFAEFEQLPNPMSHVSLAADTDRLGLRRLSLHWQLNETDARTIRAMGEAIGRQAQLKGWGRFRFTEEALQGNIESNPSIGYGSHHMGTARMADDEQFGVVNPDCRLFECDNLYLAGSAVFPTCSFTNPTLTIVALAYRLAGHLKAQLT